MRDNDADRIAYQKACAFAKEQHEILTWLRANPQVGQLASGKFYIIKDGEQVIVEALEEL